MMELLTNMLPLIFMFIMGLAMLLYVILDGYDLGIGLLLPFAGDDHEKDIMIASIGPFWDANETWIVLGVGILLIAFPQAHGLVLSSLYIPVTIMLFGLILRGVSFDFRVKAHQHKKHTWNRLFFVGSFIASTAQGWMLGAYITGLENNLINTTFSILVALTLPYVYIFLGASWLIIKTEGKLFDKALYWAQSTLPLTAITLLLVSIATPIVSSTIAQKWFVLPNIIGLAPIPLSCIIMYGVMIFLFKHHEILRSGYEWLIFASMAFICVLATIGLAYSIFPDIVIDKLTIWEAASATESLLLIFWGVLITMPAIVAYTIYVYRVFSGKATSLSYE